VTPAPGRAGSSLPPDGWDEELVPFGGHFLQSRAWAAFQLELGREVVWGHDSRWSWAGVVQEGRGIRNLYIPYGPTLGPGAGAEDAVGSGVAAARDRGLDFVRMEPIGATDATMLLSLGAGQVGDTQPQHTWILDLAPDEAALRQGLSHGHRSSLKLAEKAQVSCRSSTDLADLEVFLDLLHRTSRHGGFKPHPDSYYQALCKALFPVGAAKLYLADCEGRTVSGAIAFDFAGTRHYPHAAADQELNRKVGASVALLWRMILDARAERMTRFDFWGVAPGDDPKHPWAGLTQFKRNFGGEALVRLGTWELPVNAMRYRLYSAARNLLRSR
jgi:hypothetical protein